jgi:ribonuclease HI
MSGSKLEIYIDGASKGNPGPAGIGVVICRGAETIKNISAYIGNNTNNFAEYAALIFALQEALKMQAQRLRVNTDSQLLARQLNKEYKIKHPNLVGLFRQAENLLSGFQQVEIVNIPREDNKGADKLANKAIRDFLRKKKI